MSLFSWVPAGPLIPSPGDAENEESGRWLECLLHPNSAPGALPRRTDAASQSGQVFLTVVTVPGKEGFYHFKDVNVFTRCIILACALSPSALRCRLWEKLLG